MAAPSTRQELQEYCLRELGAPVLEINIDQDQIEDRTDQAIQFFQNWTSDSVIRTYRKHQVSATDVNNKYIDVPDSMLFVRRIFPMGGQLTEGGWFSSKYQMFANDIISFGCMDLTTYDMTQQYLSLVDEKLVGKPSIRFNRHMNRVMIDLEWGTDIKEGDYVIVDGYETLDPNAYPDVYNDEFLKEYLTALLKKQWGTNLKKFEGMQLPGGVTMNGQVIYEEALTDLERLKEEATERFSEPADFFIG